MNLTIKKIASIGICAAVAVTMLLTQPFFNENGIASAKNNQAAAAAVKAESKAMMGDKKDETRVTYKLKVKDGPILFRKKAAAICFSRGFIDEGTTVFADKKLKGEDGKIWYRIKYRNHTGYLPEIHVSLKYREITYGDDSYNLVTVRRERVKLWKDPAKKERAGAVYYGKILKMTGWYQAYKGEKVYKVTYRGKQAYVVPGYVRILSQKEAAEVDFEAYMDVQGFPDSYKPYLRELHKAHPLWKFVAQKTGLDWTSVYEKELRIGGNLVEPTAPDYWKSKDKKVYNKKKKEYKVFDGRWNQASDELIAYYLDPRNFLNEDSIYEFASHYYEPDSQTQETVRSITGSSSGCFLNKGKQIDYIMEAAARSNVNPNVLTSMILQEQSWSGSVLVSGKESGYEGVYNYFNVGAYTSGSMSSIDRGLWYANAGDGEKTYGRPWKDKKKTKDVNEGQEKSIVGGAEFYADQYVANNQYTYYTKKFNVMNGLKNVASHEYMTNLNGADAEGRILAKAYSGETEYANTFYIPVFENMPYDACPMPVKPAKKHKEKGSTQQNNAQQSTNGNAAYYDQGSSQGSSSNDSDNNSEKASEKTPVKPVKKDTQEKNQPTQEKQAPAADSSAGAGTTTESE
ncbi:MAG: N-acetylglucosaminidase [Anaerovoracaceae bacterium]|jgi:beta-N-acetylglucosaminidase